MATYDRTKFTTKTALENVCFDYLAEQTDYIAADVFTIKPVSKSDNKVYQADKSKLELVDTRAGTDAKTPLISEQFFTRDLTLVEHKAGKEINPRDVRDADIAELLNETRAAKIATNVLLIRREYEAATLATTAANYPSSLTSTLSGSSQWDSSGNPEADKQAADSAVQAMSGIKRCNAVALDIKVVRALRTCPVFVDRTKYTNAGPIPNELLKAFFDVDYIFIAGNTYNSANEGATPTMVSPWGKDVLFFYHNPSMGLYDTSFGHMYLADKPFWTDVSEDMMRVGGAGRMKIVTVGSDYVMDKGYVESASSNKFAAGYLLKSVIA